MPQKRDTFIDFGRNVTNVSRFCKERVLEARGRELQKRSGNASWGGGGREREREGQRDKDRKTRTDRQGQIPNNINSEQISEVER